MHNSGPVMLIKWGCHTNATQHCQVSILQSVSPIHHRQLKAWNCQHSWQLETCTILIENIIYFPTSFQQVDVSNKPSVEESEMNTIQHGLLLSKI